MLKLLRGLMSDRKGATAVEYGIIVALIVIAMIVSLGAVADTTNDMWNHVSDSSVEAMKRH